jgi:pimeloyl-ACP methyl ester carboxylesterase
MTTTTGAAALAPGARTAIIDGLEQRYHVAGRGPLCIVHPGGPGAGWEYLRMPAVEEYLTTVYVEPIGTGASGTLSDARAYTLERYVHFAQELLALHGKAFFLGHSHGGFVAQRLALAQPEELAGLILYATAPAGGAELWAEAARNLARFAERHAARPEAADVVDAFQLAGGGRPTA